MVFYPAYATRRPINHTDIISDRPCTTYEDAQRILNQMTFDDDDYGVLLHINNLWLRVWGCCNNGEPLVTNIIGRLSGCINAIPLSEYVTRNSIIV